MSKKTKKTGQLAKPKTEVVQIHSVDTSTLMGVRRCTHDVLLGLRSGEISIDLAQAQIRAINSLLTNAGLALEHARLSGRLVPGSDSLPDLRLDGLTVIEHAPRRLTAVK